MNFSRKIDGSTGDDQKEENEHQEQPHTLGPFLSASSSYLHPQHHQQPFFSPRPNSQESRVWLLDSGEPSSNQKDEGGWNMVVEKEHMFDKVVTPSDVGKLNRLVIPKQHAERFFPLDSSTNYKGLLLNFEDVNGKLWRFQYSYWNSSQSYVMTKGWSRFVKEKKLDAGDIVSFQRGVGTTAKDRLFIDWRRRLNPSGPPIQLSSTSDLSFLFQNPNFINPWNYNPLVLQSFPARRNPNFMLPDPNSNPNNRTTSRSVYYQPAQQQFMMTQRSELGLGFDHPPPVPVHGKGKRLRLFGVNMDCELSEDEEDDHHPSTELTNCSSTIAGNNYSSSYSTIPYLQLSHNCAEEKECNDQSTTLSGSSTHNLNSTVSNMSLDLKMSHSQEDDGDNDDDDHYKTQN